MIIDEITIMSNALHSEQIVVGFLELERKNLLNIKKIRFYNPSSRISFFGDPYVVAKVGDKRIVFDTADQFDIPASNYINNEKTTHYFKRSFSKSIAYNNLPYKLFPLGLNFLIYTKLTEKFLLAQIRASFKQKNLYHYIATRSYYLSKLFNINHSSSNCSFNSFGDFYGTNKSELILYNTRLWNPDSATSEDERNRRILLNNRRIDFVEQLSREFKHRFTGGIFADSYSEKQVPHHLLIKQNNSYKKKSYFNYLRMAKVGISVNGMHSTGWAIGEYCAFGTAIVCDPLTVLLPGSFANESNYFEALCIFHSN